MFGYIIKLSFLVVVVMIILNIFAPEKSNKVLTTFSEYTTIDKNILKENLDSVTKFTQDTVNEVSEKIKKNFTE